MMNSHPASQNGIPNGSNAPRHLSSQGARSSKPYTLHEALPYSPFTSIVPFEPGIVPTPTVGSGSPSLSLPDLVSRQDFDALNQEATNLAPIPGRLEQALDHVQHLLNPNRLTQFKFKTGPRTTSPGTVPHQSFATDLSPFSKMVYERSSVSFRYPTSDPSATARNGEMAQKHAALQQKSPAFRNAETQKRASNVAVNMDAHARNQAHFEIRLPTKSQLEAAQVAIAQAAAAPQVTAASRTAPFPTTINPQDLQGLPWTQPQTVAPISAPSAVLPPALPPKATAQPTSQQAPGLQQTGNISVDLLLSTTFNKDEYMVVPEEPDSPSLPTNLSARKRKRDEYDDGQGIYGTGLDQRQRADAAFHDLRRCFQHVFEAEDVVTSTQSETNAVVTLTSDKEPALSGEAQEKCHILIQRAISLGCFSQVPLDDLIHIQRLCDNSLKQAEGLDLKVDESWGECEVGVWLQQLPDVEVALKAARTALRLMCGGREDKQLYSEDTIDHSLSLFKNVMDGIIVPIAEMRSSGTTQNVFRALLPHRKAIASVFNGYSKMFSLLSGLIVNVELSETVVNTLEFAASRLIFVENAHTEKDSITGVQKFDGLRLVAMDMLSQIFLANPQQRQGIFNDILTSLEKLPIGKQSARQFKLADGGSIQPVSALIMRLVQTSAGKVNEHHTSNIDKVSRSQEEEDENAGGHATAAPKGNQATKLSSTIRSEDDGALQHSTAMQELHDMASPLTETARRNALHVVNFIVGRALKSTKTGDTPYRNLLDLFVEDFSTCLSSPDWPAAELLLRLLMFTMVKLVEGDKTAAPAKSMALELLGIMGASISKLRGHVRKTANSLDYGDDDLGRFLAELGTSAIELKNRPEHMVSWTGPYRASLEYLEDRRSHDPHLTSAISFMIADWADKACATYESLSEDSAGQDQGLGRLAYRLRMMVEDRRWLSSEYTFKTVQAGHARLSYSITLLRSQFCESFGKILNILLGSMASDQATVRSRSLKSINQVLETDPSILDGDSVVIPLIVQCSNDSSAQVRDSALGLMGKCIAMRPALEEKMLPTVTERFIDSGLGVRKRAMKLAKDIYLRNNSKVVRSTIANGLLHRVQDPDEGVRELARQMIEEIWIAPFQQNESSASFTTSLAEHVALMIHTVKQGNVTTVLDKVFQTILAPETRSAGPKSEVCRKLVANMFDLVDNPDSEDASTPSGRDTLQVLMIFAKADAKLFTFEQIRLLRPHIASVATSEDLTVSRSVVVIYRRVLPYLSSVHSDFLFDVRKQLLPTVSKLPRGLLDDVIACVWIISGLLGSSEHLGRLVTSSLVAIQKLRALSQKKPLEAIQIKQFERYALIVGMLGKHCDLDSHLDSLKGSFPKWQGTTVSKLMVDLLCPFITSSHQLDVRKAALDAVGLVCQSNPRNYVSANIYTSFQAVFDEGIAALEAMILRSFKEFLLKEEKRSEEASNEADASVGEKKRELTVMGGTNYDDVASATTQRFLKDITRIALASLDDQAFLAVEVLSSISRQGLVHPKETGVTLITLETCPIVRMSELAYHEHRALHEKYESTLEREYAKAIQSAFFYQRDIVKDPLGATTNPFASKLHLMVEVMKISKTKNRQRFLEKLCAQVDFDPAKLDVSEPMPSHVQFSRFVIENLAFFEYVTVGELQTTVSAMEKLVTGTGANVAHTVESEVFQVRMEPLDAGQPPGAEGDVLTVQPSVEPQRLRQLTAATMILQTIWEGRTYLRRLYGLGAGRREKTKGPAKDMAKAPVKVQGVSGDKFWEDVGNIMTALAAPELMMQQCRSFVELLNVDKEFKVAEENDEEELDGEEPSTPEAEDDGDEPGDRGRKRKATNTPGGRKKRARSSSQPRKRGRPRKVQPVEAEAELAGDGDWF